jgi:predicted RNase H-like nuclease (RuvC/YqgF family)
MLTDVFGGEAGPILSLLLGGGGLGAILTFILKWKSNRAAEDVTEHTAKVNDDIRIASSLVDMVESYREHVNWLDERIRLLESFHQQLREELARVQVENQSLTRKLTLAIDENKELHTEIEKLRAKQGS